jgi:predicted peroxiredoxin
MTRCILTTAAMLALALTGCGVPADDGVFVHLTKGPDHPHEVLMALRMAGVMADDHPVLVYFDIDGVKVLLKDAPVLSKAPFPDSAEQLRQLIARENVQLQVCPGCLKAAGKTQADLIDGVQLADKQAFFSFAKGRIITIDY